MVVAGALALDKDLLRLLPGRASTEQRREDLSMTPPAARWTRRIQRLETA